MAKILIIEDDRILNDGLCFNLQKQGHRTLQAFSLEEADRLLEEEPELLLLDVNLPDGDGFAFGGK